MKKEGIVWKLVKPLYGLKDASRKFWLKVREIFKKEELKIVKGDEAFYFTHRDNELVGMIMTHVDDFVIAGKEDYLEKIGGKIRTNLMVSKVEKDKFHFTGIDIERTEDGIRMSMEDYAGSISEIEEIRKG